MEKGKIIYLRYKALIKPVAGFYLIHGTWMVA